MSNYYNRCGMMQIGMGVVLLLSLSLLAILMLMFLASGIKVLGLWERAVILRHGNFKEVKGPGVIWIVPILDRVAMKDLTSTTDDSQNGRFYNTG
ncbi:MAG: hypothetical protein ACTSYL_01765 [Candidatus Thorarchaeota archaeon]